MHFRFKTVAVVVLIKVKAVGAYISAKCDVFFEMSLTSIAGFDVNSGLPDCKLHSGIYRFTLYIQRWSRQREEILMWPWLKRVVSFAFFIDNTFILLLQKM